MGGLHVHAHVHGVLLGFGRCWFWSMLVLVDVGLGRCWFWSMLVLVDVGLEIDANDARRCEMINLFLIANSG
jgi:hypothetical protein